ncbi:MAG: inorganic phosphate transporter [Dysgonamonadaceae bacterium]|jgi:PiT family inorganic phosphate transporter|nr:inorganic phosphate transporter [Dysgonamonadaceae bacterium]
MTLLIIVITLAILFDFINGFHDAANSIATVVTTKVLTPLQGVLWAAFFNFIAFFIAKHIFGEFRVANTVAKTVIDTYITLPVILSGIVAAIIWNLFTWWFAIPSSSSHTLIGGFAGAAIASGGFQAIHFWGHDGVLVTLSFILIAPLIGLFAGSLITIVTLNLSKRVKPRKAEIWFRRLQLFSSAYLSIQHGLNDSPKVMGIICVALISFNTTTDPALIPHWMKLSSISDVHDWVPLACFTAIALGTMMGGWKIMKTVGNKITKLTPFDGFCSQMAGSLTLTLTERLGVPVSTSHVIASNIMGVGAVKRLSAVRWGITIDMLWAWILTIPVSALLASVIFLLVKTIGIS